MTMPYFQFDDGFSEPNPLVQTMRPAEQEQQPRFSGCVVRYFSVSTSVRVGRCEFVERTFRSPDLFQ